MFVSSSRHYGFLSLNKANSLRMNNIRRGYNMEFKVIESAKDPLFNEALKLYDDKLILV